MFRFKDLLVPAPETHLATTQLTEHLYQEMVDYSGTHACSMSKLIRYCCECEMSRLRGPLEKLPEKLIPDQERSKAWRKKRRSRLARPTRKVRK